MRGKNGTYSVVTCAGMRESIKMLSPAIRHILDRVFVSNSVSMDGMFIQEVTLSVRALLSIKMKKKEKK